jgi:CubicO group peptidase (beta-lactamase class C family)
LAVPAHAAPIDDGNDLPWASRRDLTSAQFASAYSYFRGQKQYRLIDTEADLQGRRYAMVWQYNSDGRGWAALRNMTSDEYHDKWEQYGNRGFRPHDVEAYGAGRRWAGIWVENKEGLDWSSRRNMTSEQYRAYARQQVAAGRRLVDIEVYPTFDGFRTAAIFYENKTNTRWNSSRDMTQERFHQALHQHSAKSFRIIDVESYRTGSGQRYAAIWEKSGRGGVTRVDRSSHQFANLARQYHDKGYRLVDLERYGTARGPRYAGVWIENNPARFRYRRKDEIDKEITTYQSDNSVPGISVAVVRNGKLIYRRGFGWADKERERVAHGETVYLAASVSKAIGGTLAAKLENEKRLRDGTPVKLDLTQPTRSYFAAHGPNSLPRQHTHQVDQLLAHLGCVGHYRTTPPIPDKTVHYTNAFAALQSIWTVGLVATPKLVPVPVCTVGVNFSYSTPGYTFVGAVLERATGRPIQRLVRSEIATPYGLPSMRAQWGAASLPDDYERAVPYDDDSNERTTYPDNSWKVLGGGIEVNTVDLALFGWKVLDGEVVNASARDARMWSPVAAMCATSPRRACRYGLGWRLRRVSGPCLMRCAVAEMNGVATGTRSLLRVYRDKGLVVAIMSNRRNDPIQTLSQTIANIALGPDG